MHFKCDNWGVGFQILLQIEVWKSIMFSPPVLTRSAGMLLTPTDFSALTAASTASRRIG